jgi:hypothetical protein
MRGGERRKLRRALTRESVRVRSVREFDVVGEEGKKRMQSV